MSWIPYCPIDPATPMGALSPQAVVLHRTYGQWPGDYSVIKNNSLCQLLIGQAQGQWVQFMETTSVAYHCNGANFRAYGIELTGVNEDVLTDWQVTCLHAALGWLSSTHGIPLVYTDPAATPDASIWVNGGGFSGVISHVSVKTDDGSAQHTDMVTAADFNRALSGVVDDMTPEEHGWLVNVNNKVNDLEVNQVPKIDNINNKVNDLEVNKIPELLAKIAELEAKVEAIPGASGASMPTSGTWTAG